jgi:hypothetical protein
MNLQFSIWKMNEFAARLMRASAIGRRYRELPFYGGK